MEEILKLDYLLNLHHLTVNSDKAELPYLKRPHENDGVESRGLFISYK